MRRVRGENLSRQSPRIFRHGSAIDSDRERRDFLARSRRLPSGRNVRYSNAGRMYPPRFPVHYLRQSLPAICRHLPRTGQLGPRLLVGSGFSASYRGKPRLSARRSSRDHVNRSSRKPERCPEPNDPNSTNCEMQVKTELPTERPLIFGSDAEQGTETRGERQIARNELLSCDSFPHRDRRSGQTEL